MNFRIFSSFSKISGNSVSHNVKKQVVHKCAIFDQFLIRSNWDRYSAYFRKNSKNKISEIFFRKNSRSFKIFKINWNWSIWIQKGGLLICKKIFQPFLTKFSLHVIRAGFLRVQFWNSNCVWSRGRSQLFRGIIYTKMVKSEYWRSLCGRRLKIKQFRI